MIIPVDVETGLSKIKDNTSAGNVGIPVGVFQTMSKTISTSFDSIIQYVYC